MRAAATVAAATVVVVKARVVVVRAAGVTVVVVMADCCRSVDAQAYSTRMHTLQYGEPGHLAAVAAAAVKPEWPTRKENVIAGTAEATKYLWSSAVEESFVLGAGALAKVLEAEATAAAAKAAAMMAVAVAALAAMTVSRVTFERAWSAENCHHEARCRMQHTAAAAPATAADEARHGCWLVVLCAEGTPPTRLAGAGAT